MASVLAQQLEDVAQAGNETSTTINVDGTPTSFAIATLLGDIEVIANEAITISNTNDRAGITVSDTTIVEDIGQVIGHVSDIDGTVVASNLSANHGP